jgi:hypothetical protein
MTCLGARNDCGRPAKEEEVVQERVRQGIEKAQLLGVLRVRPFADSVGASAGRSVPEHPDSHAAGQLLPLVQEGLQFCSTARPP